MLLKATPRRHYLLAILTATLPFFSATLAKSSDPVIVTGEKAAKIQLVDQLSYPGKIISRIKATIASPADGLVIAISGPIGTRVAPGATVLKIRNLDPVFEYVPVNVAAPVGGIISLLDVTVGARVAKGQSLGMITDPRQALLTIEVPGSDLSKIHLNMVASLILRGTVGADGKAPYKLKVSGISPLLNEVTGTALIELIPEDNGTILPIGTVGKVLFSANARTSFSLDESALVYRGQDVFVRKLVAGKAKFVKIKVVQSHNGKAEIADGISEGEMIIVQASSFVDDNQDVVIQTPAVATKK